MFRICYTGDVDFLIRQKVARPHIRPAGLSTSSLYARSLLLIAFLAFFFVGFLGLGHASMIASEEQMSNCPFMGMAAVCKMNPLEHIAAWQNLFTMSSQKDMFALLLLLLLAGALSFPISNLWRKKKQRSDTIRLHALRSRIDALIIHSPLHEALSNGIIHSKVF